MADIYGRFWSARDRNLGNSIVNELLKEIVQVSVIVFKLASEETPVNIYGEAPASVGKSFFSGIPLYCLIERSDLNTEDKGFGVDRSQDLDFRFTEDDLKSANLYIEAGDVILFNDRYYLTDNVKVDQQLLIGQPSKNLSHIITAHYTQLASLNIINRMV